MVRPPTSMATMAGLAPLNVPSRRRPSRSSTTSARAATTTVTKMPSTATCIARIDRLQYTRRTQEAHPHMIDYRHLERELARHLGLTRRPIAVTFRAAEPAGVERVSGAAPPGCSFLRLAPSG